MPLMRFKNGDGMLHDVPSATTETEAAARHSPVHGVESWKSRPVHSSVLGAGPGLTIRGCRVTSLCQLGGKGGLHTRPALRHTPASGGRRLLCSALGPELHPAARRPFS